MSKNDDVTHDDTFNRIVREYYEAVEAHQIPDEVSLIRQHPEFAKQLRSFFADICQLAGLASDSALLTKHCVVRTPETPKVLGPYKILKLIGQGGMGQVFLAEQREPVKRQVALKVISVETPTEKVLARFEAERQALALMEHQNIAKVLDAGTAADGRPYFAMELVKGQPITEYCDQQRLTLTERLELFVQACCAIQHAHHKGVIHRDLKPSNVLVGMYDGNPVVKVIDFGLAKAVHGHLQLTDKTLFTQHGQIVGTLEYMSPEQAELNSLDIDTRTDVYSLGVILYELLTGSTPIGRDRVRAEAFDQILWIIREEESPRPSQRLSDSGDAIDTITEQRKTNARNLRLLLRGDLDWIAIKALEKDRVRRYEGPGALADDLERFLNDAPVQAHPPTFIYLLHKSFRKHRATYAAGLGFASLLFAGVLGTLTMWLKAVDAESKATTAATLAFTEADNARKAEARERDARHLAETAKESALAETERTEYTLARSNYFLAVARWEANRVDEALEFLSRVPLKHRSFEWYLAQREWQGCDFSCQGNAVTLDISPDGKWIISGGSQGGNIEVWDASTGEKTIVLTGHASSVTSLRFSPDGKRIASVSTDDSLRIWNATSGQQLRTFKGRGKNVTCVCFSHDGRRVALGSEDNTVMLCDIESGNPVKVLQAYHEDSDPRNSSVESYDINCVEFSPDDSKVVACGNDNPVLVWNASSGERLLTLHSTQKVRALDYSPDGRWIVTGGGWKEGFITVWDAETGEQIRSIGRKASGIDALSFSPDSANLIAARSDKTLEVWNVVAGTIEGTLKGSRSRVRCLAVFPSGSRIATASSEGVQVWDVGRFGPHRTVINDVSDFHLHFSPNGEMIACTNLDSDKLKVFDADDGSELLSLNLGHANIREVSFDPASKRIVSAVSNMVKVWDVETGDLTCLVEDAHVDGVSSARFSNDGAWIGTVGIDERLPVPGSSEQVMPAIPCVKIWDAESGELLRSLKGKKGDSFDSLRLLPQGNTLAICADNVVRLWHPETGDEERVLDHRGLILCEVSPNGRLIASASSANWGSQIKIWDAETGEERCMLTGHLDSIESLSFTPDGKRIASGSADGTIRLWDTTTGEELRSITSSNSLPAYPHVAFSQDGKRLLFGSRGDLVEWNTRFDDELDSQAERDYRTSKSRSDPSWHQRQGASFFDEQQWFASSFHFTWLVKHRPEHEYARNRLVASLANMDSRTRVFLPHVVKAVVENLVQDDNE